MKNLIKTTSLLLVLAIGFGACDNDDEGLTAQEAIIGTWIGTLFPEVDTLIINDLVNFTGSINGNFEYEIYEDSIKISGNNFTKTSMINPYSDTIFIHHTFYIGVMNGVEYVRKQ